MEKLPFTEQPISKDVSIRHFKNSRKLDIPWHRNEDDKIIEPLDKNDWLLQIDNELPIPIDRKLFIPKDTFHREIMGSTDLTIKVTRLETK